MPRPLELLLPSDVAGVLSNLRATTDQTRDDGLLELTADEQGVLREVAFQDGLVGFDLFAPLLSQLLTEYPRIGELIANRYPYIILDEFQDTSEDQWNIVKHLGLRSTCLALADPEQRIFDFVRTDPQRAKHFIDHFGAPEIDLGGFSHRNKNTDISLFGDDVLRGEFSQLAYEGIELVGYQRVEAKAYAQLISAVIEARARAIETSGDNWSVAVLLPTKAMTKRVSDLFSQRFGRLPAIQHTAVIERDAAILSAHCIGHLLQKLPVEEGFPRFIRLVADFYRGRSGDRPAKGHLATANKLLSDFEKQLELRQAGRDLSVKAALRKMENVYDEVLAVALTGDPRADWVILRDVLEQGVCVQLRDIAEEAKNVRFLDRGTQLRLLLAENWNGVDRYDDAYAVTRDAFVQEHFATAGQAERGVVVMNLHKAKGKQFDETVMFEDGPIFVRGHGIVKNSGRFVRQNGADDSIGQARKNFRMAVTRSKHRTTVLTPSRDKCVLFAELM